MTTPDPAATLRSRRYRFVRIVFSIRGLVVLVLLAGLGWRVGRYAANWPLWGDEAFVAVNMAERDFAGMLRPPLEYSQIVPLGFLWAELAVTKGLGLSEAALHLLPLLAGLAAFLLSWRFFVATLDRRSALLATAVLAASYYTVRHAVEVKPYATDMLAAVALLYLAWRVNLRPRSIRLWAALIVLGAAGVWCSLPSAFIVGGVGLFLLWKALSRRRAGELAALAAFGLVVSVSFVVMYVVFAGPMASASPSYWIIPTWQKSFPPLDRPWLLPWWLLQTHAGNMLAYPVGGRNFGSSATLLLVIAGAVSLWRRGKRDVVILALAPLLPALVAAALKKYPYGTSARVMLYMASSFCLLAGAGLMVVARWAGAPRAVRRVWGPRVRPAHVRDVVWRGIVVAMVVLALAGTASDVLWPHKRESNAFARQTVRAIVADFTPADRVLWANAKRHKQWLPFLVGSDSVLVRFYLTTLSPAPVEWLIPADSALRSATQSTSQVQPGAGHTWLIYFRPPEEVAAAHGGAQREEQYGRYLRELTDRLGQPITREYVLMKPYADRAPGTLIISRFTPLASDSLLAP